jgi:hypothetical protein
MPLDVLGIDIPEHLRDRMKSLREDRMQQLLVRGVSAEERRLFIAKLRAIDGPKPGSNVWPKQSDDYTDDTTRFDDLEAPDDDDDAADDNEKERLDESDDAEGSEESEDAEYAEESEDADSDTVRSCRRGTHTRLMIERKLGHMAEAYAQPSRCQLQPSVRAHYVAHRRRAPAGRSLLPGDAHMISGVYRPRASLLGDRIFGLQHPGDGRQQSGPARFLRGRAGPFL